MGRSPATPPPPLYNGGSGRLPSVPSPVASGGGYSSKSRRRGGGAAAGAGGRAPRLALALAAAAALGLLARRAAGAARDGGAGAAEAFWRRDVPVGDLPALRMSEAALDAVEAGAAAASAAYRDRCRIHVVDADSPVAGPARGPRCDLRRVWPYDRPGAPPLDGDAPTPHWAAATAFGHWAAQAVRLSPHHEPDPAAATLFFVDTHCLHAWYDAERRHPGLAAALAAGGAAPAPGARGTAANASRALDALLAGVARSPHWAARGGRNFVVPRPGTGAPGSEPPTSAFGPDGCGPLGAALQLVPTHAALCPAAAAAATAAAGPAAAAAGARGGLVVPLVAPPAHVNVTHTAYRTKRRVLLYFRGACAAPGGAGAPVWRSAGRVMRGVMRAQLAAYPRDQATVLASCAANLPAAEYAANLRRSLFCAVLPGGGPATRRLSEAMAAGCLPAVFGPPWPALPMAGLLRYSQFAVFFNVSAAAGAWGARAGAAPLPPSWELDPVAAPDVAPSVVDVADFTEAVDHLQSMPAARVRLMQRRLDAEGRLAAAWGPGGAAGSELLSALCGYARREASMERLRSYQQYSTFGRAAEVEAEAATAAAQERARQEEAEAAAAATGDPAPAGGADEEEEEEEEAADEEAAAGGDAAAGGATAAGMAEDDDTGEPGDGDAAPGDSASAMAAAAGGGAGPAAGGADDEDAGDA